MEGTIKVQEFINILKKRMLLIVSLGLGAAILSGVYIIFVANPVYESSVQLLVNNNETEENYDYNSVAANFQYINTYSDFIYTPVVIEQVIDDLQLKTDYETLIKQIDVTSNKESQIITIYVKDTNHPMAVKIANKLATVFKSEVNSKLNINNIIILSPALNKENPVPINSNPVVIVVVALIAGIIVGYSISFVSEFFDNTIKSEQDIEDILNVRSIGVIPIIQLKNLKVTQIPYSESEKKLNKSSQRKGVGGNVV